MPSNNLYRILSVDGGGIRGAFAAQLLAELSNSHSTFLRRVRLFSGTSTGSLIALGLAIRMTPDRLVKLYEENAFKIFGFRNRNWHGIGGWLGSRYSTDGLREVLEQLFAEKKLRDVESKIVVPAFKLRNPDEKQIRHAKKATESRWEPLIFHNFEGSEYLNERLVDIALASSAAPTFFPAHNGFVDGGLFANNPSVAALALALSAAHGKQDVANIRLLSIGTGKSLDFIKSKNSWGKLRWVNPLVPMVLDATSMQLDADCERVLGKKYWRVDYDLREKIELDDANAVGHLVELAKQAPTDDAERWRETINWVSSQFMRLPQRVATGEFFSGEEVSLLIVIHEDEWCDFIESGRNVVPNIARQTPFTLNYLQKRKDGKTTHIERLEFSGLSHDEEGKELINCPPRLGRAFTAPTPLFESSFVVDEIVASFDYMLRWRCKGIYPFDVQSYDSRWKEPEPENIGRQDGLRTDYFEYSSKILWERIEIRFAFPWTMVRTGLPRVKLTAPSGEALPVHETGWNPQSCTLRCRNIPAQTAIRIEWDIGIRKP